MAKDPAVLFYTSDFLSGTAFFSFVEKGQYITLLCEQHQLWSIPENHLIEVCGSLESPVVKKFIKDIDGTWFNERMRVESLKRKSFCDSRRDSIAKRYNKSTYVDTSVVRTYVRMENENRNEDIDGSEIKKEIVKRKQFEVPTIQEISDYCKERNNSVNPEAFFDFYESKGWLVGKNKMKDWRAGVRTWEKNNYNKGSNNGNNSNRLKFDFEKDIENKYKDM